MTISSKEIILLIIGVIVSIILTLFPLLKNIKLYSFETVYGILIITLIILGVLLWAFHRENNEIKEDLENQKTEQTKLGEKLKIHEQLIDMKAEIKELQKRCKI